MSTGARPCLTAAGLVLILTLASIDIMVLVNVSNFLLAPTFYYVPNFWLAPNYHSNCRFTLLVLDSIRRALVHISAYMEYPFILILLLPTTYQPAR